jgi:Raf kinase inhibitor-like YbhB/YbcL family protein
MRNKFTAAFALLAMATFGASLVFAQAPPPRRGLVPMLIQSNAFPDGGIVPAKYSNAGGSTQPDFTISNAPAETQSFAIILHDIDVAFGPNSEDVLHWVAWNIPGDTRHIEEGKLPDGSVVGKGMRSNAYMGMGAPPGPRYHHYVFEFYALSVKLDLPPTASRPELLEAIKGKVIAKAAYIGRFKGEPVAPGAPGVAPAAPAAR